MRVLSAFIEANDASADRRSSDASEPPARKMSASPNLIMRHDSPIALFEVAQAVTMQKFGPCSPYSIEISPLAMLLISIGMVKGETRPGPLSTHVAVLILERLQPADAAADDDAEALAIRLLDIDAAVCHRHLRGGHRELREAVGAPDVLRVIEEILRLEIAHLAGEPAVVAGGVERIEQADAADAVLQVLPEGREVVADGRDDAKPGDDNSAIVHR